MTFTECCTCLVSTRARADAAKMTARRFKSLIGLAFRTVSLIEYPKAPMSEQPHGGSTGRWLKRITQSMSVSRADLDELIEDLREPSERRLFDGDALVMLEVCWRWRTCRYATSCARARKWGVRRTRRVSKDSSSCGRIGHSRFP